MLWLTIALLFTACASDRGDDKEVAAAAAPDVSEVSTTSAETAPAPTSVDLISREVLFGNPERSGAQLSPDGKRIAFLAPVNMAFNAVAEAFLAKHLGDRFEEVGDDFEGSAIDIKNGAELIPGLPKPVAAR